MWTSPRYSDGAARQERKHLQINQQLKLLVQGKLREWDDYLPMVRRLRNARVQHLGYTPFEMVFGRTPQQLSPSHLALAGFRKSHPRASEYMQALVVHLEIIKKEVGRAATISYIDSWPKRNAKKKGIKFVVGDYVMLHQPVHVPGAATKLLTTSWNGPWKVVGRRSKEFDLVHIESGKCASQHVTNLTGAPDPAHAEDYNDQYAAAVQKVDPVGRIPTEHRLVDANMLVVNVKSGESGGSPRNAIAQVMETYHRTGRQWCSGGTLKG